jgi:hypothetical protein
MIDRSRLPVRVRAEVVSPPEGAATTAEPVEPDERSWRFVEWTMAILAIGAAVVLALR